MARYKFEVDPNTTGNTSLAVNPLTNITQALPPPAGPHLDVLTAMGYPFDALSLGAYRTSLISDVYLRLKDAGIIDKLDWFYMAIGSAAGGLINLIPGKSPAINAGATYSAGAYRTDGASSHMLANLPDNAAKYTLGSACVFARLITTPPENNATSNPIFGQVGGGTVRLGRKDASPFLEYAMNGNTVSVTGMSDGIWEPGLWLLQRTSASRIEAYKNSVLLLSNDASASVSLPTDIAIGRLGTTSTYYSAQAFSCFGGGAALTADDIAVLDGITAFHSAAIAALDGVTS